EINANGGVDGRDIKLDVQDHANDPATCVSVAQKMTRSQGISAIMGAWGSSCTLAMEPVIERAKIPFVVETSSSSKITDKNQEGNEWTFRLSPTSGMEAVAHAEKIKAM